MLYIHKRINSYNIYYIIYVYNYKYVISSNMCHITVMLYNSIYIYTVILLIMTIILICTNI